MWDNLGVSMKKLLVTGFEPFDDFTVNPSEEVAKSLDGRKVGDYSINSIVVPLDYTKAIGVVEEAISEFTPEVILCCGQANRAAISIERIAVNAISTKRSDNYENTPESDIIEFDGPVAYFANIDPLQLVQALVDSGIPAHVSYHAGLYGCNWLLYKIMEKIESGSLDAKATFIHLPPLPSQAIEKDMMSMATMPLEMQIEAMLTIIKSLS